MSQSPFQEQNVPVFEVCCLCGRPLLGASTYLFGNEQGRACVDDDCARALRDLAVGWEPGKIGEALRYVQRFLPYTHPAVHGFVDPYIARGLSIAGANSQPAALQGAQTPGYQGVPQGAQTPGYQGVPQGTQTPGYQGVPQGAQTPGYQGMPQGGLYPTMRQDGQGAAQPGAQNIMNPYAQPFADYDVPQAETPAEPAEKAMDEDSTKRAILRSERAERLFRVLARVVLAAIVGLAAALLSTRGAGIPALPLVLGAWLTFAYTGGRWLFKIGYQIGMRYTEPMFYPDGDSNIVLKSAATVLSVLFSLVFTAIVGAINGVIELYNTAFAKNAQELYADDNPAHNREGSSEH